MNEIILILDPATARVSVESDNPTPSVLWDIAAQSAVIETAVGPTIASRAYALTHTAIYDAFAALDDTATGVVTGDAFDGLAEASDAALTTAMSFAAYAVLVDLFPEQVEIFDEVMAGLDLDPDVEVTIPESPIAIGRAIGAAVVAAAAADGSNQAEGYADTTGYAPVNASSEQIVDITRWTPENVPVDPEGGPADQSFLTPHWGTVQPFALSDGAALRPEPPEPFFVDGVDATLDLEAGVITFDGPEAPAPEEVRPDLIGSVINAGFITQAEALIETSAGLTDEQKIVAEFWEDGGGTSFPPGTWMTFGQAISARDEHTIEEDALLFLALGNAVFDAGIATWEAKSFYDYARPVRAIRDLGQLGLIGEEGTDALTGETGLVIDAWAGPGLGTQTILAENFITYQNTLADPSPPFAEYTSGHSAFSAAGAQVLRAFTGSDSFEASITYESGTSLFEPGVTPVEPVTLSWTTFSEAADEAGLSRIYGGIHFDDGDINGRTLGREAGQQVWSRALEFVFSAAGEVPDEAELSETLLVIGRFYDLSLARVADIGGFNFWADAIDPGTSLASLGESFLQSDEFELVFGPQDALDDEAFVDRILRNVGLQDETDLVDAAEAALTGGASRGEVLALIAEDPAVAAETTYLNGITEVSEGVWAYA